jgi:hypothetical protein
MSPVAGLEGTSGRTHGPTHIDRAASGDIGKSTTVSGTGPDELLTLGRLDESAIDEGTGGRL